MNIARANVLEVSYHSLINEIIL